MTRPEFDQWWQDLSRRFPSIPNWLAKLTPPDSRTTPADYHLAILRTWYDVMRDVPLADALDVNAKMQRGDVEAIGAFDTDKEKTPNVVRRMAKQFAWEREERIRRPEGQSYERVHDNFPAGKILRRIIELRDKGMSDDESKAMALREFDSLIEASH